MKPPERSAALAKALASETGLPKDFAAQVAALAEAGGAGRHSTWHDVALLGAFVAMIGVCVAGWLWMGPQEPVDADWLAPVLGVVASQPWLFIGVAGVATVQMLTFRRRARI